MCEGVLHLSFQAEEKEAAEGPTQSKKPGAILVQQRDSSGKLKFFPFSFAYLDPIYSTLNSRAVGLGRVLVS